LIEVNFHIIMNFHRQIDQVVDSKFELLLALITPSPVLSFPLWFNELFHTFHTSPIPSNK
jgi:hypothetical protein